MAKIDQKNARVIVENKVVLLYENSVPGIVSCHTSSADVVALLIASYSIDNMTTFPFIISNFVNFSTLPKFKTSLFLVDLSKFLKYQLD